MTSILLVDEMECGRGSASSQDAAKELAAEQALQTLMERRN